MFWKSGFLFEQTFLRILLFIVKFHFLSISAQPLNPELCCFRSSICSKSQGNCCLEVGFAPALPTCPNYHPPGHSRGFGAPPALELLEYCEKEREGTDSVACSDVPVRGSPWCKKSFPLLKKIFKKSVVRIDIYNPVLCNNVCKN